MDAVVDLYTCPAELISCAEVRRFVLNAIASAAQPESLVLEFKSKREGDNVATAVAAMANTSGGLVLVGVDEKRSDPILGITSEEVDAIVQHLRHVIPDASPEVINVAIADSADRAILLLRVDADAVDPPVVLNGRVVVRVPGHSVGARRDEILRLAVARPSGLGSGYGIPIEVSSIQMWDEPSNLEVRTHAQFTLPRRAAGRAWLGSAAMEAVDAALHDAPLPTQVLGEHLRPHEVPTAYWAPSEVTALNIRYRSGSTVSGYRGRPATESAALVSLNGRLLSVLVSTGLISRPDDAAWRIAVGELRDLLLASAVTTNAVGLAAANALGLDAPLRPPRMTAWAGGNTGLSDLRIDFELGSIHRYPEAKLPATRLERRFMDAQPLGATVEDLDEVVRAWLVPLLFDHGWLGFEDKLSRLPLPRWALRP